MSRNAPPALRDIQNTAETTNVQVTNTRVEVASEIGKCGEGRGGLKSVCLEQMGGILQCFLTGLNFPDNPFTAP